MNSWKKLAIDGDYNFVIKFEKLENDNSDAEITCWLSDFKCIWKEGFANETNMLERVKKLNPQFSSDDSKKHFSKIIASIPDAENCRIERNEMDLKLFMKHYLPGRVPLRFNLSMQQGTSNEFFEQITKRMLWQIGHLHTQNGELIELIKRKDAEIEQYKLEGAAPLIRKQLITKPFDLSKDSVHIRFFDFDIIDPSSGFVTPMPKQSTSKEAASESEDNKEKADSDAEDESNKNRKPQVPRDRDWRRGKRKAKGHAVPVPTPNLQYVDTSESEMSQELYTDNASIATVDLTQDTATNQPKRPKKAGKKLNL